MLRADGRPVWVRINVTPIRGADGVLWGGAARIEPLHPDPVQPDAPAAYWLALHDPLTGAANRLLLQDRIAHALAISTRDGGVVAVIFCDIDHFKQINDRHGHERGDQVLVATVRRLQTTLRPDDTVARIGGDEIVIAAHAQTAAQAQALHARVTQALARPLDLPDTPELAVGVSTGLAVSGPGADVDELIAQADQAMYADKRTRRAHRPSHPGDAY